MPLGKVSGRVAPLRIGFESSPCRAFRRGRRARIMILNLLIITQDRRCDRGEQETDPSG